MGLTFLVIMARQQNELEGTRDGGEKGKDVFRGGQVEVQCSRQCSLETFILGSVISLLWDRDAFFWCFTQSKIRGLRKGKIKKKTKQKKRENPISSCSLFLYCSVDQNNSQEAQPKIS